MRKIFTLIVFMITLIGAVMPIFTKAQSLQTHQVKIIDDLSSQHSRVFNNVSGRGKASSCGVDTSYYPQQKGTAFNPLTLNTSTSGNTFAQWYPTDQSITISGFTFYAWQSAGTSAIVTLTCRIYEAGPDSMPLGAPLASTTVDVDSTFGGGLLSAFLKQAVFPSAVTTNVPYVVTVETSSNVNVSLVANSWTAATPNGRGEWLSSVKIGNNFIRGYNVNVGGVIFNADFLFLPHVSYTLDADFTISTCNAGNNLITFTNTSSPVFFSKFYNYRAYLNSLQLSCLWNYGDSSGNFYTVNGSRTYNHAIPYVVTLKDTLYGWRVGCVDIESKTVGATPAAPKANNNSPLCPGASLELYADTIAGASYYWTGPNGFTSTLQNPVINNVTVVAGGNYTAVAIIGACTSAVSTTYVNIVTNISATSNAPLCEGKTLSLSVNQITGAVYDWTGPNSFSSSLATPSISAVSMLDSGLYNVTVTLAGCGTLGPFSVAVPVNRIPATPVAGSNSPLCVGDNLNLTSSTLQGSTYVWSGPNNFVSNQQNPTRSTIQGFHAGTYTVTTTLNGCTSEPGSATVIVNNIPSSPVVGNNGPLCGGQSLSLTASTIAGATYSWTGPNGFTSAVQNPVRTNLSTLDAGSYSVVATLNGCASIAASTTVVVTTSTPTPVVSSNGPLCPGQDFQLSASPITGATYSWTGPNGFTSALQNPTVTSVTQADAGIYSVTAVTTGCGVSSAGSTTLVINTLPAAPTVTNNTPLCDGDTIKFTASPITGATYNWTGPNSFTSSVQNPLIANGYAAHEGEYSVFVDVPGCGSSPVATTIVKLHRIPATPTSSSNGSVCVGDTIKLSGVANGVGPNASYKWAGPNSYTSNVINTTILDANTSNAGTYSLVVTDSNCTSKSSSTSVTIKPLPTSPTATNNGPLCEGASILLQSSAITGATYEWSGVNGYKSGSQNPVIVNSSINASGSYEVVSIVNGCKSLPASTTVVINALPDKPVVTDSIIKCDGETVNLSAQSSAGVSYTWSGPSGYVSAVQNPSIPNIQVNQAGIYQVTASSTSCASLPSTTRVIVNAHPSTPVLSSNPSSGQACVGDSVQLFSNFVSNATYEWHGPAGFGASIQNPTIYAVTASNSGKYSATVTREGCASTAAEIDITVNTVPVTGDIDGATEAVVNESKVYSVQGPVTSQYTWSTTGGGSILSGANTSSVNIRWGTETTAATVKVYETNVAGCAGATKSLTVNVKSNVGLNSIDIKNGVVELYPNPSNKQVNLDFKMNKPDNILISFTNILGQVVLNEIRNIDNNETLSYDVSLFNKGMYFVNIETAGERKTIKLVIK